MEIVSIDKDGNVVVKMSARETKAVYDDLNYIPFNHISPPGAKLWALLETIAGRETL
ncbi:hypothetical protein STENM36S_06378 [Streptomyces tendae]